MFLFFSFFVLMVFGMHFLATLMLTSYFLFQGHRKHNLKRLYTQLKASIVLGDKTREFKITQGVFPRDRA